MINDLFLPINIFSAPHVMSAQTLGAWYHNLETISHMQNFAKRARNHPI